MGAKQSKRSVDISGKEAESAGEVAASIAGGEGRLEPLADADALKPQLNGDAHIHDTVKYTDFDRHAPFNRLRLFVFKNKNVPVPKHASLRPTYTAKADYASLIIGI